MIDNMYVLKLTEAMDIPTDFRRVFKKLNERSNVKIREYMWANPSKQYDLLVSIPFPENKSGLIDVLEIMKDAQKVCKGQISLSNPVNSQEILMRCPGIEEKTAKKLISYKVLLAL